MKRVIVKLNRKGVFLPPAGAWLVDGDIDYLTEGEAPADADYVAEMDAQGTVTERVNKIPPGRIKRHVRQGWPQPKGK